MHRCSNCNELLDDYCFAKDAKSSTGLQSWCRRCKKKLSIPSVRNTKDPQIDMDLKTEWVYFAQDATGRIKIGKTIGYSTLQRMKQLETANSTIRIIAATPGKESHYHRLFAKTRICGEWFVMSEKLCELINSLNDPKRLHPNGYRVSRKKAENKCQMSLFVTMNPTT